MIIHRLKHGEVLDAFWKFIKDNFNDFDSTNIFKVHSIGSGKRCVINLLNNRQTQGYVGTPSIRIVFYTPLIDGKVDTNWYKTIEETLYTALENNIEYFKSFGIVDFDEPLILDPYVDNFNPNESAQVFQFKLITS